jgi:fibronectin type 3 domain-containing protein
MKSISAISKLLLAIMIVLPGLLPAYSASAAETAPSGLLFEDDFQDGNLDGWTLNNSNIISVADDASQAGNKMLYVSSGDEAIASVTADVGNNYVYEAKVKKVVSGAFPGILVRYTDANNYYLFQPGDNKFALSKRAGGTGATLGEYSIPITTNQWYTLRLVVEGSSIKAYADDNLIFNVTDTSLATGKPGYRSRWEKSAMDDVKVWSIPDPKPAAPSSVTAADVTSSEATISWENSTTGAAYRVYRSTNATSGFAPVYYGTDKTFHDKNLASGVTYYYQVAAEVNKYEVMSSTLPVTTVLVLPEQPEQLPGIVAAYLFNDGTGTQAAPVAGSSNQTKATLTTGASWTTDRAGNAGSALDLNGTNGHVTLPAGVLKDLNEVSFAFWAKQDTLKQWTRLFDIGLGTNNYIFFTPATGANESRFVLKNGGSEQIVGISPAQQATDRWIHYAMTLSGSTGVLYVDGVEVARSNSMTIKPKDLGNTTLNYIGRSMFSADPYYDGKIDDFYIFNRALGPAEVALFTYPEDQSKVAADKAALSIAGNLSKVMSDLTLSAKGANGATITWAADKAEVVAPSGQITRPAYGQPDVEVKLTATIKRGNASDTKEFALTVLAELSDADAVAVDKAALIVPHADGATAKLILAQSGANRTEIAWQSDHPVNLRPDGMVSRPAIGAADLDVKLTATIKRGNATDTRTFDVKILAQDADTAYLFAYKKLVSNVETLHYAVSRNGRNWTELGTNAAYVADISGTDTFKLLSEDKWLKYTYANNAWTLASATEQSGAWTQEAASSFALPSGALAGSFKRINEAEWSRLVHGLSTPRTLDPVLTLYTEKGVQPRLQNLIKIDYTNNLYTTVPVVWDALDPAVYANVGTFKAQGTLTGTSTVVKVEVKVQDNTGKSDMIRNGEYWFDDEGGMIQAHGGYIIKVADTYYWFGEDKGHNSAVLKGVAVYASKDLKKWEFRNTVLTTASHPELASAKIERPKVLYNEKTNKFVLWGHWEEAGNYNQANVIVAVSDTVDGDYKYVNRFQPGGMQSRDFTVYQDDDGSAYLFSSSNNNADMNVFELTDDYLYTEQFLYTLFPGGKRESPAIVKKDGIYYMFTSGLSGWYPNQGYYASTKSLKDKSAWSELRTFGDPATYYTQSAFILSVYGADTTSYVYVGDRWNPTALMNSQYIWLPLELNNGMAKLTYAGDWDLNAATGRFVTSTDLLVSQGKPVAASSQVDGYPATMANDGIYFHDSNNDGGNDNFFDPGGSYPATWRVDLQREYDLSRIDISWREWNGSETYYTYKIEGSNNDKDYTLIVDGSQNRTTSFNSDKLAGKYRYVKLTILGQYGHTNNAGNPVSWYKGLHEVKIYSTDMQIDAPAGLLAQSVKTAPAADVTSISLNWGSVPTATAYSLYRSDSENGEYARIYSGRALAYEDYGLTVGKTYYYKVKASHAGGESDFSAAASAKTFVASSNLERYDNTKEMINKDENGNAIPRPTLRGDDGTYYYYEYVAENGFKEIRLHKSADAIHWTFDKVVLTRDDDEELAASKFEAMNFTINPTTRDVVIWLHYENNQDYSIGRAAVISGKQGGMLTFHGSVRPGGNDSRDITFYKEEATGKGYLASSGNTNADMFIYELSDDYLTVTGVVTKVYEGKHREAPSLIKKDGYYYLFTSEAAGWYPSKGMYSSATSLAGPWSELRRIGNNSTFSAQSGGVVGLNGTEETNFLNHANRWVRNAGEAGQRWLPITLHNGYAKYEYYDSILYSNETGVVVPEQNGRLLSLGKPAIAKNEVENSPATYANDGDYTTSWVGTNNTWPSWWQVDLGDVYSLSNIQISWYLHNGSEGYPQYTIETSTDGVQFTTMLDRTDSNKIYGFTSDRLSGNARYVRVRMQNFVLHNNPSNWYTPQLSEVKVYGLSLAEAKEAPTGLAVADVQASTVALSWTAQPDAIGYNVYRSAAANGSFVKVNVNPIVGASYTDATTAATTKYYYKVTAVHGTAESAMSAAVEATTTIGLKADEITKTSVKLSWAAIAGATGYTVYRSSAADGTYAALPAQPLTAASFEDSGLDMNTTYYYKVSFWSNGQESAASAPLIVKTVGEPPAVPAELKVDESTTASISLSWTPVAEATGYNVYRASAFAGEYVKITAEALESASYTDTGLAEDTAYFYKVTALNVKGESELSPAVEAKTLAAPLDIPTELQLVATSATTVSLSWKAVDKAAGYHVYRALAAEGPYAAVTAQAITGNSFADAGLEPETTYYYKVTAVSASDETAKSESLEATTDKEIVAPEPVAAPSGLEAGAITATSIALTWTGITDAAGYNIYRATAGGDYLKLNANLLTSASYVNEALDSETTYLYKVTAVYDRTEGSIESEKSDYAAATTLAAPLAVPGALTAESTTETSVKLVWGTTANAIGYHLYRSQTADGTFGLATDAVLTASSYTDGGLAANTTYYYKVTAIYASGESAQSDTLEAKTKAATVTPTPDPTATPTPVSTPAPTATPTPSNTTVQPDGSGIKVQAQADSNGVLQAQLSAGDVAKALEAAQAGKVSILIEPSGAGAAAGAKVTIPVQSLTDASQSVREVAVQSGNVTVTIRTTAEAGILAAGSKQLTLEVKQVKASELSESVKLEIGDHPVYDFSLSVDGEAVSAFNASNPITVEMKYTLQDGEKAHQIVIYYVGENGKLEVVRNVKYDAATGTISFQPAHFSRYAAAYNDVQFADLSEASWAQVKIEALAAREIVSGIGAGKFAPNRAVTRAEFAQLLLGALGLIDDRAASSLSDVEQGAWYYAAVASAEKLGIVKGRTDGSFGVNDTITREEMAVMLARAAALTGALNNRATGEGMAFIDQNAIAAYAQQAVSDMQQAGLISGFQDGSYQPKAQATRAQAATVIYKLLGL